MSTTEFGKVTNSGHASAVSLYCMASMVANEASRDGHAGLAKSLELALEGFLTELPRDQQFQALQLSYELALEGESPVPPRLRLVYSRD